MQVLRRWAMRPPADVRLLVVLDRPVAVYSGMVPGFVAGDYALSELEIDVVPLARRARAGVVLSPAVDIDPVRHEIELLGRPPIRFDLASLDVGSTVRGLDLPGVAEHALSTRPIGQFVREVDARLALLARLGHPPHVVVVGGGAAGCELAFALDARIRAHGLTPALTLVSSDPQLLTGAAPRMQRTIEREAAARGIALRMSQRVLRVDATGVVLARDGEDEPGLPQPADLVVWATGAAPIAFPRQGGERVPGSATRTQLARDDSGFLEVHSTLQTVGFDDVFAAGDCARLVDHRWVPRAGVYAVRQGPVLDHNLRARLEGKALKPYRPQRDFLSLLHLGDGRAAGSKWGWAAAGRPVLELKDHIDRRFVGRFQILDEAGSPRPELARLGAMGTASPAAAGGPQDEAADSEMACGGCAAKLGAAPLAAALAQLPKAPADASVVLGLAARDDVAATVDSAGRVTLHNIDVIRAFCDDPWLVGRVAASNALSDLFAKGGTPRHAQAVIGLPDLEARAAQEWLFQALSGIRETLDACGVSLLGGHTTIGEESTVGLAVTGEGPDADTLLRQAGAQPGDALLLTQPIGTGVVLAADMQGRATGAWVQAVHAAMLHTNRTAGQLAREYGAHAATDVTGFGLAGHLLTLLDPDGLVAQIEPDAVPLFQGAATLFDQGLRSTAHPANRAAFLPRVQGASDRDEAWLFDPQTAGGLLLCVAPERCEALCRAFVRAGEPEVVRIGTLVAASATDTRPGPGRIELCRPH